MALNDWESLSMKERALYIRLAVANGLHTTEDIRLSYNEFKKGGPEETRKLAFLSSLEESLRNNSRYNTPEWRRYLTDLAGRESGYRPNITNSIGAKGYFLLMPFNRATQWTTPTQLFEEMFKMSDANMKWFKKNLTKLDLLKAEELGIDIYGLMAGAHLGGVKGVVRALRGINNAKDMNGTSVLNYMTSFSLAPRNTHINYNMPVSYPLEVVLLNNYLPFNYTLMDSNEGNVPENILVVEELPALKLVSNIIVEEEPLVNPLDIIASVLNTVPSITTYNTPRPLTATEILALREADRNTLLTKEFENSLLRDNLLGIEEDNNIFLEGGKVWKALSNIKYLVIPDTTFTKDKTGAGDIEYFSALYPEGITYNNGYHKKHPSPGNDIILYNPNTNDTQDIMLDALHIMPLDATYDVLNSIYRNAAKDSDVAYNAKLRYTEDAKKYGVNNIDSYLTYFNNEADGLLRNMFIEGSPEYLESKRYYPDKLKLRLWNKLLLPHIDAILNYLETGIRPLNILPEVVIQGSKHRKKFGGNLFDIGGNKGRYWVDDDTMLPELVVTPKGNTIVRDEVGNPALTVGAIRDINPNATIYERVNRELKDNQYNTELPQWIVDMNADRYANTVSPGIGDLVAAGLKPMDAMMPSRWVGLLDSDNNKGLLHLFDENNRGFFIGNDQTKPFSKRYAEEHPLWATAGNLVGDVISSAGATKALQKSANELKTAYNYYTKGEGFPIDLIHNLENTPWYSDLVERYGKEFADETAKQVRASGFNTYFFGDNPKQARKAMKRYEVQRDIINKITGNPEEGKAVLAGSPAVSNNGYIDRLGAAFHDVDFNAYMKDATKTTKSHPSITMHPELYHKIPLSRERMAQAPIFETIALNFPSFDNYTVNFPSIKGRVLLKLRSEWDKNNITKHLPNPFPSLYREGVFNVSPMYNVSTRGANRTVMTKINGEPIDIFLSDTYIPHNEGILPAEDVLNWKLYFIDKRLNYKQEHGGIGLEPRQKDIDDIANYVPFSKDNPVISINGNTQYSPLKFREGRLIDLEGLPIVSDVETYPGSGEFVPTFMNYEGRFWPLTNRNSSINKISSATGSNRIDTALKASIKESPFADNDFDRKIYLRVINGYPVFASDNMKFINGEFVPIKREFANNVVLGLSKDVQNELLHNTIERNIREFRNAGVDDTSIEKYRQKALDLMNNVNVGRYSDIDYIRAGESGIGGFYDNSRNFISINEDSPFLEGIVEGHEGRHMLDHKLDDSILMPTEEFGANFDEDKAIALMQRTKHLLNMILHDAYDNDFINLPNTEFAGKSFKGLNISREAITTNKDARNILLGENSSQEFFVTDLLIDNSSDDEIFDAVAKANGYGKRFIDFLRAKGKLTPKKAQQFREAMKHVGVLAAPTTIGGSILNK